MFAQQIMPAVMAVAQIAQQSMIPFDPISFLRRMAKDNKIDWIDEVLSDPQGQMQAAMRLNAGPQDPGKGASTQQPNPNLGPAQLQNGQPGQVQGAPMGAMQQMRSGAQQGTNAAQLAERSAIKHAFPAMGKPGPAGIGNF